MKVRVLYKPWVVRMVATFAVRRRASGSVDLLRAIGDVGVNRRTDMRSWRSADVRASRLSASRGTQSTSGDENGKRSDARKDTWKRNGGVGGGDRQGFGDPRAGSAAVVKLPIGAVLPGTSSAGDRGWKPSAVAATLATVDRIDVDR